MELFASQNPRAYSLYFDLKIWFRARNVTGAFEKRAPGAVLSDHLGNPYMKLFLVRSELSFARMGSRKRPCDKFIEDQNSGSVEKK